MFVDHRTLNDLAGEVADALTELGIDPRVEPGEMRPDGQGELLVAVDGRTLALRVVARSDLRPVHADSLPMLDRETHAGIVVADRIAERSREILRERGWGWLDRRRGALRVWAPGLRIDAAIAPTVAREAPTAAPNAFTPSGRTLVLWLLTHPEEHASPRALHRELGISASQVSMLLGALKADALLRKDRRPLLPELFWALAEQWRPTRQAVVSLPTPAELGAAGQVRADRWVMTDTRAALAYGAPVTRSAEHPPDLYVPDARALAWSMARAVRAPEWSQRTATVAVAPTPLACDPRLRSAGDPWPLAHPVVVALDLAADRAGGREMLDHWQPGEGSGITRVW